MPPPFRRALAALLAGALLALPAAAAAQTGTIPQDGADVSTTPPVPLAGEEPGAPAGGAPSTRAGAGADAGGDGGSEDARASAAELPNTGSDPRLLGLAGLALLLLGSGLRLRTADADEY